MPPYPSSLPAAPSASLLSFCRTKAKPSAPRDLHLVKASSITSHLRLGLATRNLNVVSKRPWLGSVKLVGEPRVRRMPLAVAHQGEPNVPVVVSVSGRVPPPVRVHVPVCVWRVGIVVPPKRQHPHVARAHEPVPHGEGRAVVDGEVHAGGVDVGGGAFDGDLELVGSEGDGGGLRVGRPGAPAVRGGHEGPGGEVGGGL